MQVNSISDVVIAGSVSTNTNGIDVASYQGDATQYFSSFKKEEK
ncbi:hypothetical protein [Lactococcus lactis]|nr:hypothetical protein [Lactococcus lactis]